LSVAESNHLQFEMEFRRIYEVEKVPLKFI